MTIGQISNITILVDKRRIISKSEDDRRTKKKIKKERAVLWSRQSSRFNLSIGGWIGYKSQNHALHPQILLLHSPCARSIQLVQR